MTPRREQSGERTSDSQRHRRRMHACAFARTAHAAHRPLVGAADGVEACSHCAAQAGQAEARRHGGAPVGSVARRKLVHHGLDFLRLLRDASACSTHVRKQHRRTMRCSRPQSMTILKGDTSADALCAVSVALRASRSARAAARRSSSAARSSGDIAAARCRPRSVREAQRTQQAYSERRRHELRRTAARPHLAHFRQPCGGPLALRLLLARLLGRLAHLVLRRLAQLLRGVL